MQGLALPLAWKHRQPHGEGSGVECLESRTERGQDVTCVFSMSPSAVLGGIACLAVGVRVRGCSPWPTTVAAAACRLYFRMRCWRSAAAAVLDADCRVHEPASGRRTRRLLAAGATLWIGAVVLLGVVSYVDPVERASL